MQFLALYGRGPHLLTNCQLEVTPSSTCVQGPPMDLWLQGLTTSLSAVPHWLYDLGPKAETSMPQFPHV